MEEIWKPIEGYEGLYEVSNYGRIKSLGRIDNSNHIIKEKILKSSTLQTGYENVRLSKNGKIKNFLVHRLVATEFLPNKTNLPCVNHKDQNRQNNSVANLEWCTYSYNNTYADRIDKMVSKQINKQGAKKVLCVETSIIYESLHEIERKLGYKATYIWNSIKRNGTSYGYHWEYINNDKSIN